MTRTLTAARTGLVLAALSLVITGGILYAGPLDPPAGPVTSTYKTLTEVEPRIAINATNTPGTATAVFRITQPGSYFLTGNVAALSRSGIEVASNGVTIDLMGFNIQALFGAVKGITVDAPHNNITIRNGKVSGFPQGGINLNSLSGDSLGALIENIHASSNTAGGIILGMNSVVRGCTATSNSAGSGIFVGHNSTITSCAASSSGFGIQSGTNCTILDCTMYLNAGPGIKTGFHCVVSNCAAFDNDSFGIHTEIGSTISNCSANSNANTGIVANFGTVTNCSSFGNEGDGFLGAACVISNCAAFLNTSNGIRAGSSSLVSDCTVGSNARNGIDCDSRCVLRGNTCSIDGTNGDGAGIHAFGSDNRIEGNNCTLADRGIDVGGANNIIIRNTCTGNTIDWVIAANNVFGPIIDRRAPASAAVSGFSAPSTLGSTDSNANFSY